jgi:peptidoglycan hydrolase-like protein with peptidoglycan-binding domain
VQIDGQFGPATQSAVTAAQRLFGLPQTGIVDKRTWERLSDETALLLDRVDPADFSAGVQPYPGFVLTQGMRNEFVSVLQNYLIAIAAVYPDLPSTSITGYFGPATKTAVTAFQRKFGLTPDGVVGPATWQELLRVYDDVRGSEHTHSGQYPGTPLTVGYSDFPA